MSTANPNRLLRHFHPDDPCGVIARGLDVRLPDGAEKTAGIRKLLEASDCFKRAALPEPAGEEVRVEVPVPAVIPCDCVAPNGGAGEACRSCGGLI